MNNGLLIKVGHLSNKLVVSCSRQWQKQRTEKAFEITSMVDPRVGPLPYIPYIQHQTCSNVAHAYHSDKRQKKPDHRS